MRVIHIDKAIVTFFFPMDETRPQNGIQPAELITAIAQRYEFMEAPNLTRPYKEFTENPPKFSGGKFVLEDSTHLVQELNLYRDGISAITNHSDVAEAFIGDLFEWLKQQFGFRSPTSPVKILYVTHVIVEFERELERLLKPLTEMRNLLEPLYQQYRGVDAALDMKRFSFGVDPTKHVNGQYIADFYIERRLEQPYEINRYLCETPFPTNEAISALGKLEALI